MNTAEIYTLIAEIEECVRKRAHCIREGQAYFNAFYERYPELADQIRGTANDPFHHDDKIVMFIEQIKHCLRHNTCQEN